MRRGIPTQTKKDVTTWGIANSRGVGFLHPSIYESQKPKFWVTLELIVYVFFTSPLPNIPINGGKINAPANRPIINVIELEITPVPIFTTNIKSGRALQEGPNSTFRYNGMSSISWQQKRKAHAKFYLKVKYPIKNEANLNLSKEFLSHRLAFSSVVINQKWFLLKLYWILEFHFTLMPSNHLYVWMKQSIRQLLRSSQSILFLCNFLYLL